MCGRYADFLADQDLADAFSLAITTNDERLLPPSFNVAPMQRVHVIRAVDGANTLEIAKWGLVPSWAKDPSIGSRMINARVETVAEKPSFRTAFSRRRCIVPAKWLFRMARPTRRASAPSSSIPPTIHPWPSPD